MKKILFILRNPPHSGTHVQETLDFIMTVAAFDQEVSILLLDNAVFQIKKQQSPEGLGLKATAALFKALPIYNINTIYTETESLSEMGLTVDNLAEPVIEIPRMKIGELLKTFEWVLPG